MNWSTLLPPTASLPINPAMMNDQARWRKRRLATAIGIFFASGAAAAAEPTPEQLYGNDILFSVWRDGNEIGQHHVVFTRVGDTLTADSHLELAVTLLGVVVFRYKYDAQEIWHDGVLDGLDVAILDDGKPVSIKAKRVDGKLDVTGPAGAYAVEGPIMPTTHWDDRIVGAKEVLDTLNGKLDKVQLESRGVDTVPAGAAGPRTATHYVYTGDLTPEVWYDSEGHWLKLRFLDSHGTPVEYVCVRCVAPP
jgi:hypothetical protein